MMDAEETTLAASDASHSNNQHFIRFSSEKHAWKAEPVKAEGEEEEEDDDDVLLTTLPKELVIEVFGFCSVKDVCTARGVSKGWCRLIQSDALLWRRIGRRDLALNDIEEFMTPAELAQLEVRRQNNEVNWVDIYKRVFGGGWDGRSPHPMLKIHEQIDIDTRLLFFETCRDAADRNGSSRQRSYYSVYAGRRRLPVLHLQEGLRQGQTLHRSMS